MRSAVKSRQPNQRIESAPSLRGTGSILCSWTRDSDPQGLGAERRQIPPAQPSLQDKKYIQPTTGTENRLWAVLLLFLKIPTGVYFYRAEGIELSPLDLTGRL